MVYFAPFGAEKLSSFSLSRMLQVKPKKSEIKSLIYYSEVFATAFA